ncbi:MAG: ATP-dependent Lon protease [Bacteroidetes bacterium]|nr:ATP-dependent Lon protease [Bacteroidota bacterium]
MPQESPTSVTQFSDRPETLPTRLPVLPLRDVVIFPYMIFPVLVGRESSLHAVNEALERDKYIFLAAQKNSVTEEPGIEDIYHEGTIAKIIQILKLPNGLMKILVDGVVQASVKKFLPNPKFLEAQLTINTTPLMMDSELDALLRHTSSLFAEYVHLNRNVPSEVLVAFENTRDPQRKLFYIASNILQTVDVKQKVLQLTSVRDQLHELIRILNSENDVLKIEKEIDTKVHDNIAKSQRKFFIQEQIRILQDELGDEESSPELLKLREDIKKAKMPKQVEEKAMEEFGKLRKTPPLSPESTVLRGYLDWMINVPWQKRTKDNLDIAHVKKILDEDHFGLDKPKERILEHIAVLNLVKEMKGQILCFVGPPGVGKTSLAKSIARALGRTLVRISLGGVRDEAEIRGHRRTYIGSMPGKIIQSMKRAGVINPVMLLDEVDKMSMDFRGDPSAALLEVLDPEQNVAFNDHYLDIDYDLSHVMFITTANVRYAIPLPLQDRMEIIELPGYLQHDKREIAKRHIIPKQLEEHGLARRNIEIQDNSIDKIITEYTREAGVRNLEREIATVCRKVAKDLVLTRQKNGGKKRLSAGEKKDKLFVVDPARVESYLGVSRFRNRPRSEQNRVGSVTGLAWTSVGGEILHVDVTVMNGHDKLTLTGQLGEVMKESAQAALSYLRSNAQKLGLPTAFYKGKEIHVHLPEGAIPKDGPSAGITMAMAMFSAVSNEPARADVAMTGEITLRGDVLAIGGLNEKLLAAQRSGVATVLIPQENVKDLPEIQAKVKEGLTLVPISTIEEALPYVFARRKVRKAPSKGA